MMISGNNIAVVVVLLIGLEGSMGVDPEVFDWCDPELDCGSLKNSMCYLIRKENTKRCFSIEDAMTNDDKELLIAMHNSIRDQVAEGSLSGWPAASDMRQMAWHDTLAAQATLWASQCNESSDPCPKNPYFSRPGQASIEIGDTDDYPSAETLFKQIIKDGKKAPKHVDHWKSNGATAASRSFHQIIYGRSNAMGCGLVRFLQQKNVNGKKVAIFTTSLWCNYGIGLEDGQNVYTVGDACSDCKDRTTCNPDSTYPHLCASDKDKIYGEFIALAGRSQQFKPTSLFPSFPLLLAIGVH